MRFVFTGFDVNAITKITCKLQRFALGCLEKCSNLITDFLILSAFCSLASAFSHIAAVLFKLKTYLRMDLHKVASTSKLCRWKRSDEQVASAPLGKINFGRPKQSNTFLKDIDDHDSTEHSFRKNFTAKRLTHGQDLKLLVPESSILTTFVDEECKCHREC